jgi:hypothetical protein
MQAFSIDSNNWLMHYPTLRRVNHCRRLIQAEFGVRAHLSDPELRDTLAHYAGHSRSRRLQEVYAELRMALIELEGPDELSAEQQAQEQQRPQRMYRGRPLPEPETDAHREEEDPPTAPQDAGSASARTIVYRGQTVKRG